MSQNGNKVMILAAGLGTRLRPLTNEVPKALIPVAGRPLIHYSIALFKKYGFTNITINLHHLGKSIEEDLGDGSQLGVSIAYSHENEILGTGGGIKKMAATFGDEDFWVLNSDILIDADLEAIAAAHHSSQALATMVLRAYPSDRAHHALPTALFMNESSTIVDTSPDGQLTGEVSVTPQMFTGLHLINTKLLDYLPDGPSCIFQNAYRPAIAEGKAIKGYEYKGYWKDLGTMEQYEEADTEIASGKVKLSYM